MSIVREFLEGIKEFGMDAYFDWEEQIYNAALNSDKEKNELIKLFNEEDDIDYKIDLAKILSQLGYTSIVTFLKKDFDYFEIDNKCDAIICLVYLHDNDTMFYFNKFYNSLPKDTYYKSLIFSEIKKIKNATANQILKDYRYVEE